MPERPRPPDRGSPLWKRWREVDRVFEAALDIPEEDRAAFLRDRSAGDTELYDILADLLEITASADPPLDRPGDAVLRAALGGSEPGEGDASPQATSSPG